MQLPLPVEQGELQSPPLQLVLLVPLVEQGRPQAPQFCGSDARMLSQPLSLAGWVQLPKPAPQIEVHKPALQLRVVVLA